MRRRPLVVLGAGLVWAFAVGNAETAWAQGVAVQLPTFQVTGVSTTVLVPDQGSALLGGVSTARSGATQFGPGRGGRSLGSDRGASQVGITAWIHDLRGMDEALLRQAVAGRTIRLQDAGRRSIVRLPSPNAPPLSVAEIRARQKDESSAEAARAAVHFSEGQRLEAAGKPGAARIHYQMAARRATGALRAEILARLATLSSRTSRR